MWGGSSGLRYDSGSGPDIVAVRITRTGRKGSLAAVRDGLVSVTTKFPEIAVRAIVVRVAAEIVCEIFADLPAQFLDPLTRLSDLGVRHRSVILCHRSNLSINRWRFFGELPHPARPDGLAEGGASCFCVGACIRRGHSVHETQRVSVAHQNAKRSGDGSRLRRRRFGVSHSYWLDGAAPRADTRFLSRLNVGLLSYSRKERVVPCGTTSESGAVTRNAHLTTTSGRSDNNCIAV